MSITPFLADRTFEPDQITLMSAAFADTCNALGLEPDHALMPVVAEHVMGLGKRGVKTRAVLFLAATLFIAVSIVALAQSDNANAQPSKPTIQDAQKRR